MAHPIQHAPRRLVLAVCLFAACAVRAAIPLADPPQDLKNEDGTPEVGLVDPFVPRGAAEDPDMPGTGLTRTAAGELPADFRILAISIPEQGKPSALVRMGEKEDPTLVHEGDQVRVPRPIPRGRARAEEALEEFPGCSVVISHDRWFLDRVATHILAWEGTDENPGRWHWFEGNFEAYQADREKRLGAEASKPHRLHRKLTRD